MNLLLNSGMAKPFLLMSSWKAAIFFKAGLRLLKVAEPSADISFWEPARMFCDNCYCISFTEVS